MVSTRRELGLLRYALPCWAVMALLCALLPAPIQTQWGLLLSPWFWALLTIVAWRLRRPRAIPIRQRPRRRRGATRRSRRSHATCAQDQLRSA
jgi:hypothetical protein